MEKRGWLDLMLCLREEGRRPGRLHLERNENDREGMQLDQYSLFAETTISNGVAVLSFTTDMVPPSLKTRARLPKPSEPTRIS